MTRLREKDIMAAEVMKEKGWSIRSLARGLGVDESTLRYRLNRRASGATDGRRRQPEACAAVAEIVLGWMAEQSERVQHHERPQPVRALYEELVSEHGYTGSYKSVLRYVRRRTGRPRLRPIRRVEMAPGAQAQVDWVQVEADVASLGGRVKLWAFVMVLSSSRMWRVIWSRRKDMASWIRCHNEAFLRLGGIPLTVRPDNEKTAAGSGAGPWARINEGYESYAKQMGFLVNLSRPRKPTDKGKVERRGRDVKWLRILADGSFPDLAALQAETDRRTIARARTLTCPQTGMSIYDSWKREQTALRPLPLTLPEPFDVQVTRTVKEDCLVSFEGRQYSVPFHHVGRQARVRGCGDRVLILVNDEVVKEYPRHTRCRLLIDQSDYEGESNDRVIAPTPLGKPGRSLALARSWEAPVRPVDQYEALVRRLS